MTTAAPTLGLTDLAARAAALLAHMAQDESGRAAEIAALSAIVADLQTLAAPPSPAPREVLETYSAWLHMERRLLSLELYPELGTKGERFVPHGTPGDCWHFRGPTSWRDLPQPSSRAATVLHALGVLPEIPD